jgi:hypothetical protein
MLAGSIAKSLHNSPKPSAIAAAGLSGVEGVLNNQTTSLRASQAKKSVNVPPTSTPISQLTADGSRLQFYTMSIIIIAGSRDLGQVRVPATFSGCLEMIVGSHYKPF